MQRQLYFSSEFFTCIKQFNLFYLRIRWSVYALLGLSFYFFSHQYKKSVLIKKSSNIVRCLLHFRLQPIFNSSPTCPVETVIKGNPMIHFSGFTIIQSESLKHTVVWYKYSVFHQLRHVCSILSSSQFLLLPQRPLKITHTIKWSWLPQK